MKKIITEGKAKIKSYKGKISKKLPVFYNPVMEFNRTSTILLLKAIKKTDMQIALPLAGSGIRALRLIKELPKKKIKKIYINDYSEQAVKNIKENLKLNEIPNSKVSLSSTEANLFLLRSKGFDYIDIDPFGTPNPFLDVAVKRLARNSILAVTATDTAALCGTYPKACKRKYFSHNLKNPIMHELGLRILARKVQLIGAQYNRALKPIFSYSKNHYMRIFFHCQISKTATDKILKQHKKFHEYGPLWTGQLWDKKITNSMAKKTDNPFIKTIQKESAIQTLGYYHIHKLCKAYKLKSPKTEKVFKQIKKQGYKAVETHLTPLGIRSNIPLEKLIEILKKLNKKK
jgi:tRNA (guanine26-N2/guanine27-N2)-dimethyltransferase